MWIYAFILFSFLKMELLGHRPDIYLTLQKMKNRSLKYLYHFTLPPAMCEGSSRATPLPTLTIVSLLFFSHLGSVKLHKGSWTMTPVPKKNFLSAACLCLSYLSNSEHHRVPLPSSVTQRLRATKTLILEPSGDTPGLWMSLTLHSG